MDIIYPFLDFLKTLLDFEPILNFFQILINYDPFIFCLNSYDYFINYILIKEDTQQAFPMSKLRSFKNEIIIKCEMDQYTLEFQKCVCPDYFKDLIIWIVDLTPIEYINFHNTRFCAFMCITSIFYILILLMVIIKLIKVWQISKKS